MSFKSINPATGEIVFECDSISTAKALEIVESVHRTQKDWGHQDELMNRCNLMKKAADVVREQKEKLAQLITLEMGKTITESRAEVDKCVLVCDYYAENGPQFLADEKLDSPLRKAFISNQPFGTVLAVMPWNFPLWQVFRFAAPALVAGNCALLKHASNVPQCALAVEEVFQLAGFPDNAFRSLMIRAHQVEAIIEHPYVHAVTLTGSEPAGRQVAAIAGQNLKKTVLELGGSDAFIVLENANIKEAVKIAVQSRFLNNGQSCIAAKRFIVDHNIADDFVSQFKTAVEALVIDKPTLETSHIAPLARADLRDELHQQVTDSLELGATLVTGGHALATQGFYYAPTILDHVTHGMRAYHEELFGPVASIIRVTDVPHAIGVANDSDFGLGGSVWSDDLTMAEVVARNMQSGACFINSLVKSHPSMPFGGIKNSGYGRELGKDGILEFVNRKTIAFG